MNAYFSCSRVSVSVWMCVERISISCLFMCGFMQKCRLFSSARIHVFGVICSGHTQASSLHKLRCKQNIFLHLLYVYLVWFLNSAARSALSTCERIFFITVTTIPFAHCSATCKYFAHNGTFNLAFPLFLLAGLTFNLRNNFYSFPSLSAILVVSHSSAAIYS